MTRIRTRDADAPQLQTLGGWLADGFRDLFLGDGLTTDCVGWLANGTANTGTTAPACCTAPDCPNRTH